MTLSARAAHLATAASLILVLSSASPSRAGEESLLIWSPSKLASHAFRLRMGARAAPGSDASAGVDLSIATSSTGKINASREHARFWAEMGGASRGGAERRLSAGYNPMTGKVSTSAGVSKTWMGPRGVDFIAEPSVAAEADSAQDYRASVRVSQKARLSAPASGTALVATGTARSGDSHVETSLALEQRLFNSLNLAAAVEKKRAEPVGSLRARLAFSW